MTVDFRSSFAGRSVFVTGHTGFKGSWLCLWLHALGARVTGYALEPPTQPSHFEIAGIEPQLERHHQADLRDLDRLKAAMREARPDLVLHLAAQSVVRTGHREPAETFEVNVMGTVNVLEGVRALGERCAVLCVTSDKCYENVEQVWGYRESDAFGDHDPYGASKGAAELAIRAYSHSYFPPERADQHGVRLASARAGNVIGGGDWTCDALLVDIVAALAANRPVGVRNPIALRPWQHVIQALSGYLTIASRLLAGDDVGVCSGWNIGPLPGNEIPVRDVVEIFLEEWGSGSWVDESQPDAPREARILRLAIDKALWELPWRPCWNIRETLRRTAQWYRAHGDGSIDMRQLGLEQIAAYEQVAFGGDAAASAGGEGPALSVVR